MVALGGCNYSLCNFILWGVFIFAFREYFWVGAVHVISFLSVLAVSAMIQTSELSLVNLIPGARILKSSIPDMIPKIPDWLVDSFRCHYLLPQALYIG